MTPLCAPAGAYSIRSGRLTAWIIPRGARLMQLFLDDKPLCLGFADPADYASDRASIGAVCGRYGNRIAGGRLERDGAVFELDQNEGEQCLHGGTNGFGHQTWAVVSHDVDSIRLRLDSPDGDQGWPGRCVAEVSYRLTGAGLEWEATADVDRPCPLNLIQHAYWNLGVPADAMTLQSPASEYWVSDANNLPLLREAVSGDLDFRQGRVLGRHDHDVALMVPGTGVRHMATLSGPLARLAIHSDQPSVQLYSAGHLRASERALGAPHHVGNAVCLETQQLPNGPALGEDVWIEPGQTYRHQLHIHITPQDSAA
ncbi:hypothetical protein [Litorivicinus lipolyticus]|uniref:aldose epimerase family protein n=1 Tax=Litorivicinus lipolyticus TaxID=418701 RepID=UPI003B58F1C7